MPQCRGQQETLKGQKTKAPKSHVLPSSREYKTLTYQTVHQHDKLLRQGQAPQHKCLKDLGKGLSNIWLSYAIKHHHMTGRLQSWWHVLSPLLLSFTS
jgi:hypothetical protein